MTRRTLEPVLMPGGDDGGPRADHALTLARPLTACYHACLMSNGSTHGWKRIMQALRLVDGHADVWRLFDDAALFPIIVDALVDPFRDRGITKVAGIEARGFVLGGACALRLNAGFVAIRKAEGLFPGAKVTATAGPDYRGKSHLLRLQKASLRAGDRVLLVDDWCETGSQALAARSLIEAMGADFVGFACIVDQAAEGLADRLGNYHSLIKASG